MNAKIVAMLSLSALACVAGDLQNDASPSDDKGVHVNAHGGCILKDGGRYWWYGEHKVAGTLGNTAQVGVHVYSSENLRDWKDEGIALAVSESGDIERGCVLERPKVLKCEKTGKYVMYFHLERKRRAYNDARVGIAVSDSMRGPFKFLTSLRPNAGKLPQGEKLEEGLLEKSKADEANVRSNGPTPEGKIALMWPAHMAEGQHCRDMTLFKDDDGKAYHIYASEHNSTLHIAELTDDYLDYTGRWWRMAEKDWTEAPAVVKNGDWYYLLGSGCTGWKPNAARYYRARSISGPWERMGNPCRGVNPANGLGPESTWGGQSTFIIPAKDSPDGRAIAMFDVWNPNDAIDGRYIWLPIEFGDGDMEIVEELKSSSSLSTFQPSTFQTVWPDGSPVGAFFRDLSSPDAHSLGKEYRLIDNGIYPDSAKVQTAAIQSLIDKVETKGGGVIVVTPGIFVSGALFFRPCVHLKLERGAILLGSADIEDYPVVETRMEGQTRKYFAALVNADRCDGFTMFGEGIVDGNGYAAWRRFWIRRQWAGRCPNGDEQRPRLVYVSNSRNVRLDGVSLQNSWLWTTHFYRCENVKVTNLVVYALAKDGAHKGPSTDGFDFDVVTNALVRSCSIAVNDDAISIKGGKGPWADDPKRHPENGGSRNLLFEKLSIVDGCHTALALGSECPKVENVVFRDSTLAFNGNLVNMKFREDTVQLFRNILVENVNGKAGVFIRGREWREKTDFQGRERPLVSCVENLAIRNCHIRCREYSQMDDMPSISYRSLLISDNEITKM